MNSGGIKAYSYIRFSSSRQRGGDSVRRQMEMAHNYARENGLDLQDLCLEDLGVSAFRGDNIASGALSTFLEFVHGGLIERGSYLLVENFDRLSRQQTEVALANFLNIVNAGVVLVTLSDGHVYRAGELDSMSLMMSILYMARANDESEQKSRRTKAVWTARRQSARENGQFITNSNFPRWLVRHGSQLIIKDGAKELLERIFNLSCDGMGHEAIAKILNESGCTTFQHGKEWVPGTVGALLKNRAVLGEYQPHEFIDGVRRPVGDVISGYYPQVIEPSLFLSAQNAISSRNRRGAGYRRGTFSNLFIGLVRCQCGRSMTLSRKGSQSSYLKCQGTDCTGGVRYEYAESQILIALSHIHRVIDRYVDRRTDNDIAVFMLELQRRKNKLEKYSEQMEEYPSARLAQMMANEESQIELLEQQIRDAEARAQAEEARHTTLLTFEALSTAEERAAFNSKLKSVLDYIEVTSDDLPRILIYRVEGQPVLEQHFFPTTRGSISTIYDMDGHIVAKTQSRPPHVITERIDEEVDPGYEDVSGWDEMTAEQRAVINDSLPSSEAELQK